MSFLSLDLRQQKIPAIAVKTKHPNAIAGERTTTSPPPTIQAIQHNEIMQEQHMNTGPVISPPSIKRALLATVGHSV